MSADRDVATAYADVDHCASTWLKPVVPDPVGAAVGNPLSETAALYFNDDTKADDRKELHVALQTSRW